MKSNIEIFRTGTHTDMNGKTITVSHADLVAMAAAYDPMHHEAPIVMGHPAHNDPAMGWVKALSVSEGGALNAELHQVNPDFSEVVDKGAFKKISASLYPPGSKGNPAGDNYGLRHVGFLGGAVPAIKGLKSVQFAGDDAETLTFTAEFGEQGFLFRSVARAFRTLRDYLIEDKGTDIADKALPSYVIDDLAEAAVTITEAVPPAFAEQDSPRGSDVRSGGTQAAQGAVVPPSLKKKGARDGPQN